MIEILKSFINVANFFIFFSSILCVIYKISVYVLTSFKAHLLNSMFAVTGLILLSFIAIALLFGLLEAFNNFVKTLYEKV